MTSGVPIYCPECRTTVAIPRRAEDPPAATRILLACEACPTTRYMTPVYLDDHDRELITASGPTFGRPVDEVRAEVEALSSFADETAAARGWIEDRKTRCFPGGC